MLSILLQNDLSTDKRRLDPKSSDYLLKNKFQVPIILLNAGACVELTKCVLCELRTKVIMNNLQVNSEKEANEKIFPWLPPFTSWKEQARWLACTYSRKEKVNEMLIQ